MIIEWALRSDLDEGREKMHAIHAITVPFGRRINGPDLGVGKLPLS